VHNGNRTGNRLTIHPCSPQGEVHRTRTDPKYKNKSNSGLPPTQETVSNYEVRSADGGGMSLAKPQVVPRFGRWGKSGWEVLTNHLGSINHSVFSLGCIFLPESSGFLYFPIRSPVSHRNLNFHSAVILFFGIKRSKNLRSKTKASGRDHGMPGYQVVQFCSFCGLQLSNWMWLLH
jgi:hypothetical protein